MYYLNSFFFYSLLGFIFESAIYKITSPSRVSGILYEPITLVYGLGGLTILFINKYIISKIKTNKILKIIISFLIYSISLGLIEYLTGYLSYLIFNQTMWNYQSKKYNIGKYTCLEYIPLWGILAFLITKLEPFTNKILNLIPRKITYFLLLITILDLLLTIIKKTII